jgi:hypothetical protein
MTWWSGNGAIFKHCWFFQYLGVSLLWALSNAYARPAAAAFKGTSMQLCCHSWQTGEIKVHNNNLSCQRTPPTCRESGIKIIFGHQIMFRHHQQNTHKKIAFVARNVNTRSIASLPAALLIIKVIIIPERALLQNVKDW